MKNYDIYGKGFQLHIAGDYTINSKFGGFLSIVTSLLMIVYVILNGADMFLRKDPTTYQENQTLNISHALNFTKSEFRFYFNLFYGSDKSVFVDPTYLKIKFITKSMRENNKTTTAIKNFTLTYCTRQNFENKTHAINHLILDRLVEKKYYCPDFTNFTLSGSWIENQIEFGQIQVFPCDNKTDNVKCKSFDDINDFVMKNKIYISIYYPLSVVKLGDYISPINYNLKEDYFYIRDFSKYSFYYYGFDKIQLTTDSGVLLPFESDKEGVSMSLISNDQKSRNDIDNCVFSLDFYSSFNLIKYKRSYIKILDVISNFGGMVQIVTILFQTIVSFLHTLQRVQFMSDKLFFYENPFNIKNAYDDNLILSKITNIQEKMKEAQELCYFNKHKNKNNIFNDNIGESIERNKIMNSDNRKNMLNYIKSHLASKNQLINKQFFQSMLKNSSNSNSNFIENKDYLAPAHKNQGIELRDLENLENGDYKTNIEISKHSFIKDRTFEHDNQALKQSPLNNSKKTDLDYLNKSKNNHYKTEIDNKTKVLNSEDHDNIPNNNMINDSYLLNDSERRKINRNDLIDKYQKKFTKLRLDKLNLKKSLNSKFSDNNEVSMNFPSNNKTNEIISNAENAIDGSENIKKLKFIKRLLDHKKTDALILSFYQQCKFVFQSCINLKKIEDKTEKNLILLMNKMDEKTESYFDFLNIIKVIEEANFLKNIIMSSQQKVLMELMRKEHISVHDIEQINYDSSIKILEEKKFTEEYDDDKIIEAVNNLFDTNQRDSNQEGSNHLLKIKKHFIEILEEKIHL